MISTGTGREDGAVLDKSNPARSWIDALRKRYPCETEIDRLLTRKMQGRPGKPYAPLSLETLAQATRALIAAHIDGPFEMSRVRWLSGGASKLQVAFDIAWTDRGENHSRAMVLRMEPAESIVETSRQREFEVIKAVTPYLPVPPAFWVDRDGTHLPYPGLVYGMVSGVNKPTGGTSRVSALGVDLGAALRPVLAAQFLDHITTLHGLDVSALKADSGMESFDMPAAGTQAAAWQVNWWRRVWEEDANEDIPLLAAAEGWMRENLPVVTTPRLVHGDFRSGNFLFDEASGRITAWLDWELAHFGDFHEDLAWVLARPFGHFDESGTSFLVTGLFTREAFLEAYQRRSGLPVDAKALKFYSVFVLYKCVVLTLSTGYRVVRGGKTHQDSLCAFLMAIGYVIMEELRRELESA
jgi:aminoglycoside phosphotransferase (APT) family kinase protein